MQARKPHTRRPCCWRNSTLPLASFPMNSAKSSSLTNWKGSASRSSPHKPASASTHCSHENTTLCCTCVNDCRPYTTNLQRNKENQMEEHANGPEKFQRFQYKVGKHGLKRIIKFA